MARIVEGGHNVYGKAIGILLLNTRFPRIPGDIGNATTFDFPVAYKVVKGATHETIVEKTDPQLLKPFIEAAQELEREGVKAITTSCGFLAIFQEELASSVKIPVFTSSLLQVPLVYSMLKKDKKVGIITVYKKSLSKRHLEAAGIESIPVVIYGLDNASEWPKLGLFTMGDLNVQNPMLDLDKMESEIIEVAKRMVRENSDVGAIVFECTNMCPYASSVQKATGLPVFDITTLTNYVYDGLLRKQFHGWL
jgi:Asp/Glu/hydantoin racemase